MLGREYLGGGVETISSAADDADLKEFEMVKNIPNLYYSTNSK
jgi:hypothetical protein